MKYLTTEQILSSKELQNKIMKDEIMLDNALQTESRLMKMILIGNVTVHKKGSSSSRSSLVYEVTEKGRQEIK